MPPNDLSQRATCLNTRFARAQAVGLLHSALMEKQFGKAALVSSFGTEAVVLLHMVSLIRPDTPVLFIDTEMLFPETLDYQRRLSARLGFTDVRLLRADAQQLAAVDPTGTLHQSAPDTCCALRKTAPLLKGLKSFDAWISGRKRFQGGKREALELFEPEPGTGRIKLNPLANWSSANITAYITTNNLPPHPLIARGYGSVGCAPCTAPGPGRSGRWQGSTKTECGIHFDTGQALRTGANT
jgi:phosphoadenosine phosphosulfate reductase